MTVNGYSVSFSFVICKVGATYLNTPFTSVIYFDDFPITGKMVACRSAYDRSGWVYSQL